MGIFLFKCQKCKHEFEEIRSYKDKSTECKKCKGKAEKIEKPLIVNPLPVFGERRNR